MPLRPFARPAGCSVNLPRPGGRSSAAWGALLHSSSWGAIHRSCAASWAAPRISCASWRASSWRQSAPARRCGAAIPNKPRPWARWSASCSARPRGWIVAARHWRLMAWPRASWQPKKPASRRSWGARQMQQRASPRACESASASAVPARRWAWAPITARGRSSSCGLLMSGCGRRARSRALS